MHSGLASPVPVPAFFPNRFEPTQPVDRALTGPSQAPPSARATRAAGPSPKVLAGLACGHGIVAPAETKVGGRLQCPVTGCEGVERVMIVTARATGPGTVVVPYRDQRRPLR